MSELHHRRIGDCPSIKRISPYSQLTYQNRFLRTPTNPLQREKFIRRHLQRNNTATRRSRYLKSLRSTAVKSQENIILANDSLCDAYNCRTNNDPNSNLSRDDDQSMKNERNIRSPSVDSQKMLQTIFDPNHQKTSSKHNSATKTDVITTKPNQKLVIICKKTSERVLVHSSKTQTVDIFQKEKKKSSTYCGNDNNYDSDEDRDLSNQKMIDKIKSLQIMVQTNTNTNMHLFRGEIEDIHRQCKSLQDQIFKQTEILNSVASQSSISNQYFEDLLKENIRLRTELNVKEVTGYATVDYLIKEVMDLRARNKDLIGILSKNLSTNSNSMVNYKTTISCYNHEFRKNHEDRSSITLRRVKSDVSMNRSITGIDSKKLTVGLSSKSSSSSAIESKFCLHDGLFLGTFESNKPVNSAYQVSTIPKFPEGRRNIVAQRLRQTQNKIKRKDFFSKLLCCTNLGQ